MNERIRLMFAEAVDMKLKELSNGEMTIQVAYLRCARKK
ncbi:hypothetical protein J2T15_000330 [Paenibacillus harenae]|uniref:Uncharacterized protein n=1 Tax=Paenibacillus harenae TaxID=306543 RepID=A0ABT9TU81_PAEHA|nr:hypothetical protein [Paenibacillus harenae]